MNKKLDKFHRYMIRYEKMVKCYAGKFVGNYLAEDVAQEVLFTMYQKIDSLRDDTVSNWLLVVTKHIALDYLKKGGSVNTYPVEPCLLSEYMESAEEEFFEREEKQKAAAALCGTAFELLYEKNPRWYEVVVAADVLGMSSRQIAKEMDVTPGYVNLMKFRAKKYLNKMLGSEYEKLC